MYLDLKEHLTYSVPKINCSELKQYVNGTECFYFNGSMYFPKPANLNELIGEALAKYMKIRTVNFNIFENTDTNNIFIASKTFINPNSKYINYDKRLDNDINSINLRSMCIDDDNYQNLLNNIFKMFAIDIYMGQQDRCFVNYKFEEYDTGYFDLAPLYDYSESIWNEDISYTSDLYDFYEKKVYDNFFTIYPNSLEMIKMIKVVDLRKILGNIEISKGIKLPQKIIDVYLKREEITQKKLEKIIK